MKATESLRYHSIDILIVRAPLLFPGYTGSVWLTSSLLLVDMHTDDYQRSPRSSPPRDTDMPLTFQADQVTEPDLEADDESSPRPSPPRDTAILTDEADLIAEPDLETEEPDPAVEAILTAARQKDETRRTDRVWLSSATNHPEILVKLLNYIYPENCSDFQWCLTKVNRGKHIWFVTSNCCSRTLL